MSQDLFSIDPCYDDKVGAHDYALMGKLGLPEQWLATVRAQEALGVTWIGVREYFWTPDDWFHGMPKKLEGAAGLSHEPMDKDVLSELRRKTGGCFYALSLNDQARTLSLPLVEIEAPREKVSGKLVWRLNGETFTRVEAAGLAVFKAQGWHGTSDEGRSACAIVGMVRKAIGDAMGEPIQGYMPAHRSIRDPEGHLRWMSEYVERNVHGDWIHRAIKEEVNPPWQPPRTADALTSIEDAWEGLGAAFFRRLVQRTLRTASSSYSSGWPDVTLWKGNSIKLVEVKHNDKFHRNQAYWIRNFGKPSDLDVSVLRFRDNAQAP